MLHQTGRDLNSTEQRNSVNPSQYANFKFASQSVRECKPIVFKSGNVEDTESVKVTMQKFNMAVEMTNKRKL